MEALPSLADRLSGLLREARAAILTGATSGELVLDVQHRFEDVYSSWAADPRGEMSEWEAVLLERTRRAVILALRRQAASVRDQGVARGVGPPGSEDAPLTPVLQSALVLTEAALRLHKDGDTDLPETVHAARFLRRTLALASDSRPAVARAQAFLGGLLSARPRVFYTAAALVVGISAVVVISQMGKGTDDGLRRAGRNASTSPPHPSVTTAPQVRQEVRLAGVVIRSVPSGAGVLVSGKLRGRTPFLLEGKPGESFQVTVRKDNLAWRGAIALGTEGRSSVLVKLSAVRPEARPGPVPRNAQARFDEAVREGILLYEGGWYGPAIGRFKEAVKINPGSAHAHFFLGRALMQSKRHTEARRSLQMAISIVGTGPLADQARTLLAQMR